MFALLWDFLYPFPLSRPILIGCVTTYFILMGILTLYTTFKEKGIFVVVMQKDPAGMDPDSRWEAASNMKKYDDKYELTLTYLDGKTKSRRETTVTKSAGDFIDENGVICQDIIEVNVYPSCRDVFFYYVPFVYYFFTMQISFQPVVLKMHNSLSAGKKDK